MSTRHDVVDEIAVGVVILFMGFVLGAFFGDTVLRFVREAVSPITPTVWR